ncbi:30S ribosomal protein S13 [Candidatus Margulisiibacteriota bacterium]
MARLSGVDLPRNKKIKIALRYIYGIGPKIAVKILSETGIDPETITKDLSEAEIIKLRNAIQEIIVEGDLRRQVQLNKKRLIENGSYRGSRHRRGLPTRGQRTHTNGRTRKGKKRIAVAGKKKVTK